jgi:hypothetical protein
VTREPKSTAARIREHAAAYPSDSPSERAKLLGCTKQAVESALRHTGRVGRPRTGVRVELSAAVMDAARQDAHARGVTLEARISQVVTQRYE